MALQEVLPPVAERTFAGLTLDPFQIEAIDYLDRGESVIVSAPTGVGKTLVADYLIARCMQKGERVIYTAPIKALSNQKYKEFKAQFGAESVGILTGDVVINPDAAVLIMTTEIFRNILLIEPRRVYGTSYVILDEIHFIADEDRGSVWEESLIFMPKDMRFLGLSATIPNVGELAEWVSSIREDRVKVVTHFDRIIPLTHYLYEKNMGVGSLDDLLKYRDRIMKAAEKREAETGVYEDTRTLFPETTHIDLIEEIRHKYLPCLYFVFSRKQCEIKAAELAERYNFLSPNESAEVLRIFDERIENLDVKDIPSTKRMRDILRRGIGVHHAGLLPALKEIVEALFETRHIKVLYCTETFAVGINMPVKAVCFDSWQKYDGLQFRDLNAQEYFQMSGRAGRRGIDKEGFAFILVNMRFFRTEEFPRFSTGDVEDLRSRFKLSYNTVLNLVNSYTPENIRQILDGNFAIYQLKHQRIRLQERLDSLQKQESDLGSVLCEHTSLLSCPLEYVRIDKDIRFLRGKLKSIPHRHWHRRKAVQSALTKALKKIKGISPKTCEKARISECDKVAKVVAKLRTEISGLQATIQELDPVTLFHRHFSQMVDVLKELNYIADDGTLTSRGAIASEIHVQELLVTEIICSGILRDMDTSELAALAVSVDYVPRKEEIFTKAPFMEFEIDEIIERIVSTELKVFDASTVIYNTNAAKLAYMWASGQEFKELLKRTQLSEGDIVLAFRRSIDLLRQIKGVCRGDSTLVEKIDLCIEKMDRDVVRVDL